MTEYRTGNHWGVTIVREGTQPPDASGKRPDAEIVAVVTNGDRRLAQRICDLLNADRPTSVLDAWSDVTHDGLIAVPESTESADQSDRRGRDTPAPPGPR